MNFTNFTGSLVKLIPVDKPWYYPYTDTGASIYYTNTNMIQCKQNYNMYLLVLILVVLFLIITYYISQSQLASQQASLIRNSIPLYI